MSRRRKRDDTDSTEGAPDSKKSRPSPLWEWEGDGGKWSKYAPEHSQQLTDALLAGKKDLTIQVAPNVRTKIRFSTMTQMNASTGWQRNIRCCQASGPAVWEWQEDGVGLWRAHTPAISCLLEACHLCGVDSTLIESGSKRLTVDVKALKQTDSGDGSEASLRRVDGALLSNGVWEWQDEKGVWSEYPPDICRQLEGAQASGIPTIPITATGRSYTVHIGSMEQTNDATGVVRKVRRKASAAGKSSEMAAESGGEKGEEGEMGGNEEAMSSKPTTSSSTAKSTGDEGLTVRVFKGKVPVDHCCHQKVGKAHIYCESGTHWEATLNQTQLRTNNNKFYIVQLLEEDGKKAYSTWFRWGRVGKTGQSCLTDHGGDLEAAKDCFRKKFLDKTQNNWEEKDNFVKHPSKYDLVAVDFEAEDEPDAGNTETTPSVSASVPPSNLDSRVQSLVELICDVRAMEDLVREMKYDSNKAPLGKLSTDQIKSGYVALKAIEDCINRGSLGDPLVRACENFYTRIPHCFGMQRPPLIRTKEEVKEKMALLEALGDIQIALKMLGSKREEKENPVDQHYHGLHCNITLLEHSDKVFNLVEKYVRQTHGKTHTQYTLQVLDIYALEREGEEEVFSDVGNRQLLWHGSRLTNWVGILSQGLRIAPPEAPSTGYMFGKGIYFADISSKSANYCFATPTKDEGLLLLCEVALGNTHDLVAADNDASKLPKGKHSIKGLGRMVPDPTQTVKLPDGCEVPLGTPIDTGLTNKSGYTLNYNEFVVYDMKQVKMRYLVKLRFRF